MSSTQGQNNERLQIIVVGIVWSGARGFLLSFSWHRIWLAALVLGLLLPTPALAREFQVVLMAEGFEVPSNFVTPGAGDPRILVLERETGKIRTILDGVVLPDSFLDIGDRVRADGDEEGLVGIAFPPNFRDSKHVYVAYTPDKSSLVLSRFSLTDDTQSADADSESVVLRIERFAPWHFCGHIVFGPLDGFLYLCVGDADEQGNPRGTAQDLSALQGKILRIDVESGAGAYSIPKTNPFISVEGARPEIFALGLRNPWRFSIDTQNGDLFIPDVGRNSWEEINFQSAESESGLNYGWNFAQGNECRLECGERSIVWPLIELPHTDGICAVIGGMVYRGSEFPDWSGVYIFSDFCSAKFWGLRDFEGKAQIRVLGEGSINPTAIGPGPMGEIMATDYGSSALYRILLPDYLESEWQDISTFSKPTILDARRKGNRELSRVYSSKTWRVAQWLKGAYFFLRLDRIYK